MNRQPIHPLIHHIACNCLIMLTILSDSRFYRKPFYVGKQVKHDKTKNNDHNNNNNNIQLNNKIQRKIFNRSNAISNGLLRHYLYLSLSHFKWAFDYISRQLVFFFSLSLSWCLFHFISQSITQFDAIKELHLLV